MASSRWIVYEEVKKAVNVEDVLRRYDLLSSFRPQGQKLVGPCPIHEGQSDRRFAVSPSRDGYFCHGSCKKGGNVIDLVAALEGVGIREAAIHLANAFDIQSALVRPERQRCRTG